MKTSSLPLLSILLYLVACFFPVLTFVKEGGAAGETWYGAHVLFLGWLGLFVGNFAWTANLFYMVGSLLLIFKRASYASPILCGIALAIGLTIFTIVGQVIPADEGGVGKQHVQELHGGTYVWLASLACQVAAGIYQAKVRPAQAQPPPLPPPA